MSKFKHSLLAGAIMLAVSAPAAAQFTGAFFFGDSLSDEGSYKPVLPPGTGLFTTNPGPLWPSLVANVYGFNATPANQGGNDYAYGGARVTQLPGIPPPRRRPMPLFRSRRRSRSSLPRARRTRLHCIRSRAARTTSSGNSTRCKPGRSIRRSSRRTSCLPRRSSCSTSQGSTPPVRSTSCLEHSGHRQDAGWRRLGRGPADHAGRAAFQQHAAGGARRDESECDPVEHVRTVERGRREPRRVSDSPTPRRVPAARRRRSSAPPQTSSHRAPRRPTSSPTGCIRRRGWARSSRNTPSR